MEEVLRVENARKRFGGIQALDGADLHLRRGELLALLGPNGAGKTTLIRAVTGRVRLDAGEITLFGSRLGSRGGEGRRRVGIVPQEVALYDLLTARENLRAFGRFQGLERRVLEERIAWALEWTGLGPRADELVKGYSGGMKRRLNIACGVLHRPEAVLLDEPTVGVDPQSRERIWEMLDVLRGEGSSLLLTTHQLDEAQDRSERIVILDHGRVIASGTLAELFERTLGSRQRATLLLDRPIQDELPGSRSVDGGKSIQIEVRDLAQDLPPILERLRARRCAVNAIQVETPSLRSVFIHLTGRELRE